MPSDAIRLCLDEMDSEQAHLSEQLHTCLQRLQDFGPHETVLMHVSQLREHIALIESTAGWLKTLDASGYPGFSPGPPLAFAGQPDDPDQEMSAR